MKFVPASQSAKDLQYIEARKLTREEVASAYFIPPTMLGLMGGATYSNITEQHKMLYQDTLGPWLQMIKEEIELQLVPDLADGDVYVEFNLREKLTGSFEERQAAITGAVGGPTMTINEARALDNRTRLMAATFSFVHSTSRKTAIPNLFLPSLPAPIPRRSCSEDQKHCGIFQGGTRGR